MIRHPDHRDLTLLETRDVDALRAVREWMDDYLCRPLAELGRRGPVCPYTQASLDRGLAYLAVRPGRPADPGEVAEALRPYREWFIRLAPPGDTRSMHATIMVLFPDALEEDLPVIDAAQALLKPAYVADGLMIGEFHQGPPDKPGLWNPDLRPLASPVAMLVIRHMVATDFPFLREDRAQVRAYLDRFGHDVPAHLDGAVRAAIENAT
ncbi:hypothetical protein HNP84_001741 [Thermocatellispora tengchongensis]|uniref:DUF6875 domain-containing protein n=1 Tax=Thermocatellispora tengchongensis TaxID=1073253 RepID=A0A840NWY3_9ACTN|nr:hypothetical protein [Thermocatellispora tengchongensis]MBB5132028.1 hypothetical protein [Thermocatellispora tengchongensis]